MGLTFTHKQHKSVTKKTIYRKTGYDVIPHRWIKYEIIKTLQNISESSHSMFN